ncbi:MAG: 3-isopropylmalate dehydratase large subunit, partial [Actinomycetia bacterium]|nr:3-isopropylmalate dehydratase large subunit [Actinomycetes bacterium]
MGKTIAEKFLSKKGNTDAKAGDIVIADLDFAMGQDGTTPLAIKVFYEMGGEKLFSPDKVGLIIDHSSPSPNEGVSKLHKMMRDFSKKTGAKLYDIGEGICHQLLPEHGLVVPGDLVVGADSHTCTYGALGAFSTGVGSTDLAAAMISGKMWFKVPETIKIILKGKLPKGVYSKDIILYLIGKITADGATYKAVEIYGEIIDEMSMDGRFTVSNMVIEMGAKAGFIAIDEKTEEWVKKQGNKDYEIIKADEDALYIDVLEFDISNLEPQIAKPHRVDNVSPISELKGTKIDQVFLGTCTNGRLEDLRVASTILKGKKVKTDMRMIIAPASRDILMDAISEGIINIFLEAGACLVSPGCGCCVGTHNGVPSDNEKIFSTANRNFKG